MPLFPKNPPPEPEPPKLPACRFLMYIGSKMKIAITNPMLMYQGTPSMPRTICNPILNTSEAPRKI